MEFQQDERPVFEPERAEQAVDRDLIDRGERRIHIAPFDRGPGLDQRFEELQIGVVVVARDELHSPCGAPVPQFVGD